MHIKLSLKMASPLQIEYLDALNRKNVNMGKMLDDKNNKM